MRFLFAAMFALLIPAQAHAAVGMNSVIGGYGYTCPAGIFTTTQTNPAGTVTGGCFSTTTGPAIVYNDGGTHTVQASQVGPCGDNNTTNASQCITVTGSTTVNIYDNYIHVERLSSNCAPGDTHDNIHITGNGTAHVNIKGNVIAFGQKNINGSDSANIAVDGNFLLNPRGNAACSNPDNLQGNQSQIWGHSLGISGIAVTHNYVWSSTTGYPYAGAISDMISFGGDSPGFNASPVASNNWVGANQGLGVNDKASGIICDGGCTGPTFQTNIVSETHNTGIGVVAGSNILINGNKVLLSLNTTGASGIIWYTANGGDPITCPVTETNNVTTAFQHTPPLNSSSVNQGNYNDGSCATPTGVHITYPFGDNGGGNTIDTGCSLPSCAAYTALNPLLTTNPPPLIPPVPHTCTARSPYTTQTSPASCS